MSLTALKPKWGNITPNMVKDLANNKTVNLIDVREVHEYERGHIPGSTNIPLSQLVARIDEIEPEKETIFVCRSGNRSGIVCEYLSSLGYKKLKNMVGGMNEWKGQIE